MPIIRPNSVSWNPPITDITTINVATPNIMPINDTHEITEPKPRRFAPRYLNAIFRSSFENIFIYTFYSLRNARRASPANGVNALFGIFAASTIEIRRGDINTTNSANGLINVSGVVTNECVGIPTIT